MAQDTRAVETAATAEADQRRKRAAALRRAGGTVIGLVVLLVILNLLTHGDFLAPNNVLNILRQIAVIAVLAAGQTFVIITAGIDLSVGSLIALTGVLMAGVLAGNTNPIEGVALAIIVGLSVGGAAGAINGLPVVKFNLPPFITTLAMLDIARVEEGEPIEIDNTAFTFLGSGFLFGGIGHLVRIPGIPTSVLIMLAVVIVGQFVLTQTRFGRYVYAIGGNEEAARLSGINVGAVKLSVYVISGALAGLASLLLAARLSSGIPQSGGGSELLNSIAAVVVGGTSLMGGRGSMTGTFVGALLIGVLYNLMNLLNVNSYAQDVALGAVILAAVLLDELRRRYFAA